MKSKGLSKAVVVLSALFLLRPSAGTARRPGAPLMGVFPFLVVSENRGRLSPIPLDESLAKLLSNRLNDSGQVQARALPWPAGTETRASQGVRFSALLAAARQAGVHSFIIGGVTAFEDKSKGAPSAVTDKLKLPDPTRGRVRISEAHVALEGALIDTLSEQALVSFKGEGQKADLKYTGIDLAGLPEISLTGKEFGESLLGRATDDALRSITAQVAGAAEKISPGPVLLRPRQNQPPGTAFTQSQFRAEIKREDNQWSEVEVYNAGAAPQTFVLGAESPPDLPAGFMGAGSRDAALTLPPGEWKKVRFVAMAGAAQKTSYEIPVSIYLMSEGEKVDPSEAAAKIPPHDRASVILNIASPDFKLEIVERPSAAASSILAQKYSITNRGADLPDFAINLPPQSRGKVICQPAFGYFPLASGETIEATFVPRLSAEFTRLETQAILSSGPNTQTLPLIFEIPRGKKVYLARGQSSQSYDSKNEYCTNSGGRDTRIDGPKNPGQDQNDPCSQLEILRFSIKQQEKFLEFYNEVARGRAKFDNEKEMDDAAKDYVDRWSKENVDRASGGEYTSDSAISGGRYDFCTQEYGGFADMCGAGVSPPLCNVINDSIRVHEEQHNRDAHDPEQSGDRRYYCTHDNSGSAQIAAEWEVNAYQAEIDFLKVELLALEADCPGRSGAGDPDVEVISSGPGLSLWDPADSRASSCLIQVIRRNPRPHYLLTSFSLPYSLGSYRPHDTRFYLNGHLLGELLDTVPEGTYLWEVNPSFLDLEGRNVISTKIERINNSHYVVAGTFRIIAPVSEADRLVIASSQEEADDIYAALPNINHDQPDLVLLANSVKDLPREPRPGQSIRFRITAMNIGEAPTEPARLRVLSSDLTKKTAGEAALRDRLASLAKNEVLKRFYLGDLAAPLSLPSLAPGRRVELPVEFVYFPGRVTRVFLLAEGIKNDANPADNMAAVTFIPPDNLSPLEGIDWPAVMDIPILVRVLDLPKIPDVESRIAVAMSGLVDKIPYLRDIEAYKDLFLHIR
jgi:hypothetical protein